MNANGLQSVFLMVAVVCIVIGRALWKKKIASLDSEGSDRVLTSLRSPSVWGFGGMVFLALVGFILGKVVPEYHAQVSATIFSLLIAWLSLVSFYGARSLSREGFDEPLRKSYLVARSIQIMGLAFLGLALSYKGY